MGPILFAVLEDRVSPGIRNCSLPGFGLVHLGELVDPYLELRNEIKVTNSMQRLLIKC